MYVLSVATLAAACIVMDIVSAATPSPLPDAVVSVATGTAVIRSAPDETLEELIGKTECLNVFALALLGSDVKAVAGGDVKYTVFAPPDDAFTLYNFMRTLGCPWGGGRGRVNQSLATMSVEGDEQCADPWDTKIKDRLKNVLMYHIVEGVIQSSDLSEGKELLTLQGEKLIVSSDDYGLIVGNDKGSFKARIVIADVEASNGVVHVINHVLLPSSMAC